MFKFLRRLFGRRKIITLDASTAHDIHYTYMSGRVCDICKEPYVGVAQDCRCTNYGR